MGRTRIGFLRFSLCWSECKLNWDETTTWREPYSWWNHFWCSVIHPLSNWRSPMKDWPIWRAVIGKAVLGSPTPLPAVRPYSAAQPNVSLDSGNSPPHRQILGDTSRKWGNHFHIGGCLWGYYQLVRAGVKQRERAQFHCLCDEARKFKKLLLLKLPNYDTDVIRQ